DEGKFPELRKKYEAHVAAMLKLLGSKTADADAKDVLEIEKLLASAQMSKEERREPKKVYHLTQKADLKKVSAEFPWDSYLSGLPLAGANQFNVAQPDYLKTVGTLLASETAPIAKWRSYFKWHLVHQAAGTLSSAFVQENFQWQKALAGVPALPPRWKRCVRRVDAALGEALAQPFVKKTLGTEGKANTLALVHAIEGEMKSNIEAIGWMDKDTKKLAFAKLSKIANQIAFPDKWRSYDSLKIERGTFFANVQRANEFEEKRTLAKIGKPVDRQEWFMTPPTVNAYYDPSMNQMVFPAGILQPPFYSNAAHPAANFGGIGMVMGHELTHGFDDEGRQFDADGNLKDWWTKETNAEFERRASCVEKQFDGYKVLGEKVNGKLTLGENIADLGGVKLSFAALVEYA
ncbi:MAG: M13 family peptidase, partial [Proteobacteria bacterium]